MHSLKMESLLVGFPVPDCPVDQVIDKILVVLDQLVCIHRLFLFIHHICLIKRRNVATETKIPRDGHTE